MRIFGDVLVAILICPFAYYLIVLFSAGVFSV
jgi:hypothetical protein